MPPNGKTAAKQVPDTPSDLLAAGRRTWALLHQLPQVVFPADEPLALRLARTEDELSSVRQSVIEQGSVFQQIVQNARGEVIESQPVVHPGLLALRRLGSEAGELCSALGIGPLARHNLGLAEDRPPGWLDELKLKRDRLRRTAASIPPLKEGQEDT
jgi:hypothetical protein